MFWDVIVPTVHVQVCSGRGRAVLPTPHAITNCISLSFSLHSTVLPIPSYYSDSFSILHCQAAKVESVIAEGGASRFR